MSNQYLTLLNLTPLQISFVIVAAVVLALGAFCGIFFPLRHLFIKKKFRQYYYQKIYRVAFNQDYYLINDFLFRIDDSTVMGIDHILFADRYIFIINDYYYDGDLLGNADDKSLIFVNKKGNKQYTDNPFITSEKIVSRLSMITGIDSSLMIGVVLVNNSCKCFVKSESKQFYIVQRKYFKMLVKNIESRTVGRINPVQLDSAVKAIYRLNRRKRK
ncbi:MAG TPA: hypothetical protein PKO28_04005 [Bacilli bacterium]|nr:hypothetical protein [Bacilli bacterium]HPS19160.1 hypothetical protein [Bacilli bacterium]